MWANGWSAHLRSTTPRPASSHTLPAAGPAGFPTGTRSKMYPLHLNPIYFFPHFVSRTSPIVPPEIVSPGLPRKMILVSSLYAFGPDLFQAVESGLYGRLRAGRRRRPSPKPLASAREPFGSGLIDIAVRGWQACKTDHRGPIDCAGRHPRRWSRRSSGCVGNAGRDSRSPPRPACHRPRSAVFSAVWD